MSHRCVPSPASISGFRFPSKPAVRATEYCETIKALTWCACESFEAGSRIIFVIMYDSLVLSSIVLIRIRRTPPLSDEAFD